MTDLEALLAVARGDRPADLLLDRCRLVDLATGTVRETAVAIARGRIAGFGAAYEAERVVDLDGLHLAPGLIDAHVHIESSLVVPSEFARAVVPRGVTTVVTDPHEIANVAGLSGIRRMIEDARGVPLDVRVNASSCVPASPLGTGGAELDADDLASLLDDPESGPAVLGLAEVMNFPGVVAGAPEVLAKIDAFRGRPIDGHSPGLSGQALAAYVAAGIESDHECVTAAEARERLELGMTVFLREATNARNLRALLPVVDRWTETRVCLATDDRVPADLLDEGSIDHMVRVAIEEGIEPLVALAMGSANTARHFRLGDRGLVAPGRRADLWAFENLRAPRAEAVWIEGVLVAAGGEAKWSREAGEASDEPTVHLASGALDPESFRIEAPTSGQVRVIEAIPDQIVTGERHVRPRVEGGCVVADPERDLAKIVVLERHAASGRSGKGLVTGVGLRRGAIAGTFAHDHHNLVVIGADDRSMATAARAVAEAGGGLAAADGDRVLAVLPLPFGGLMSRQPIEEVRRVMDDLLAAARDLGSTLHDPFMAMSFLTLEVIPKLKITDQGLVDVERFEVVGLGV
jgi:adenine deaminase